MSYNNDSGRYLRESMRLLGETYSQSTQNARHGSKIKTYRIPRLILGVIGLVFIKLGLFLMDGDFHLSIKFIAFSLFGSGIVISLHLFACIVGFFINLSHRRLNRYRLKNRKKP